MLRNFLRPKTSKLTPAQMLAIDERARAFVDEVWNKEIQPELDNHKAILRTIQQREQALGRRFKVNS